VTFKVFLDTSNLSNSHTSENMAYIKLRYTYACRIDVEGLITQGHSLMGSHVHCKSGNVSPEMQDSEVTANRPIE